MTFAELRDEVPLLNGVIAYGEGKTWAGQLAIGANVLTVLSAAGAIVRSTNAGAWTTSRPRWTAMAAWLGAPLEPRSEADGTAGLVEAWLRAFGPGTESDVAWWLGSTLTAVRRALAAVKAVAVDLDGRVGYVMPDDLDDVGPVPPWIALLPPLDPTTMGWKERDWYLGPHKQDVFDTNGNAGATIWCDGRIVGGWRQDGARRGRGAAARGRRPRRTPGHRRRSRAPHRLAGRRARAAALPVTALPTVTSPRAWAARTP